jgi:S-adenosylmethionine synthetase
VDIPKVVRKTVLDIGYDNAEYGFDGTSCAVLVSLDQQSTDIKGGVDVALEVRGEGDSAEEVGAGDQGMMIGYAVNETPELMPLPISLAHQLTRRLAELRKNGQLSYLRPDGKSQVTVEYSSDHKPLRVDTVVISTQHAPEASNEVIERDVIAEIIKAVVPGKLLDSNTKYVVNPSGKFVIGGPHGDAGLTGRKIIVDTYGGSARHGGGAFSGKDPTKVDRSGAYAARYVAKNLVAAGVADRVEVQLSYAIGVSKPISIWIETYGTGKISNERIVELVEKNFDLRAQALIDTLNLRRPIYRQTAAYGHFGREDLGVPWEALDKVDAIKASI